MENRILEGLPIGIYHSDDSIKCLKVKVKLRKLEPSSVLSENIGSNQATDDMELLQLRSGIKSNIHEEYEFLWQEKVFSNEDVNNYSGDIRCDILKNSEEKSMVKRENVKESSRKRIFSYVDTEFSLEKWQNKKQVTIPPLNLSCIETKITAVGLRNKILYPACESKTFQMSSFPASETIVQWPSKETVAISHAFETQGQFMVIMADISSFNSFANFESEEVVLCFLHFDSHGVLTVIPDFNLSYMPYTVVNSKSESFEYTIEHTSNSIKEPEAKREKNLNKKLCTRHAEVLGTCVGMDFEVPLKNNMSIFICGEIVSARNFIADSLYVQYYFDLPKKWFSLNAELLTGVTNTCTPSKANTQDKFIYFGFPLNIQLQGKIEENSIPGNLPQHLQMFVEIVSFDNWGCCRTEGYGYCNVPLSPGCHTMILNTWKLVPQSLISKLRHYFIGGTPCLEDLTYTRFPSHTKDQKLSKYATQTETSGTLTVKFNTIISFG